ncbi:MAG TPA: hypothetical protein VLD63_05965 [Anaerolineales bacterium]|nr:hypothetical protein [Anaerolineales bacterium]
MERSRLLVVGGSLALNGLASWTLLPLAIPPYHGYSLSQLLDVLLWQGIGAVGWPLAVIGAALSLPFAQGAVELGSFLLLLLYPAMLFLLIRVFAAKALRRWELPLLHLLLTLSFAAIWYRVLNGYGFMAG